MKLPMTGMVVDFLSIGYIFVFKIISLRTILKIIGIKIFGFSKWLSKCLVLHT